MTVLEIDLWMLWNRFLGWPFFGDEERFFFYGSWANSVDK